MNKQRKTTNLKNILTGAIIPATLIIFAVIIGLVFGFNKGIDFNGGLIVSVVADEYNLEIAEEYNKFKTDVDDILENNGVRGSIYITENHSEYQSDVLVVKIEFNGTQEQAKVLVNAIKSELVAKFYAGEEAAVENSHLVEVSTFGPSVDNYNVVITILATLITVIAICVYIGLRTLSLHAPIIAFLSATISAVLSFALIMLTRIQIYAYSLALIPIASVISCLVTFMFITKTKELLKLEKFEKSSNMDLCANAIQLSKPTVVGLTVIALIFSLVFTFTNLMSPVIYFGLSLIACIFAILYSNVFIIPALYALTYVRKVKKERAKKEQITNKLDESEVLKETDLDNLVSN